MRTFLFASGALLLSACSQASAPEAQTPPPSETAETPVQSAEPVAYGTAGDYVIDPGHTSVTWRVSHFGLSMYTGRFKTVSAELSFNPEDPSANRVTARIDPASVETDYPGDYKATHPASNFASWNEDMARNANWFNADAFPEIVFTSTSVTPESATTGLVTGDLTFLGVTRPVTLNVTYNGVANFPWAPETDKIGFSATTTLKRSDFGMMALLPNIGDEVEIIIETEFAEVAPAAAE